MSSKKLTWLLLLQGWTMLWVVIGHAPLGSVTIGGGNELDAIAVRVAEALFTFAYSFHMPLFIMISGYLFYRTRIVKGWKYLDMVKEKWLRLGIPYMVFILLAILMKVFMPGEMDRPVDTSLGGILMNFIDPYNGALREMWFVMVIFVYFLLYPIYPYLLKSNTSILITLVVAVCIHFLPEGLLTDLFAINRVVRFFIYFFVGMLISSRSLEPQITNWKVIIVCILTYIVTWILKAPLIPAISASLAFWGLAIKIDDALSNNIFHTFRNYTYQIFLIGIFAQIAVKVLYRRFAFEGSYVIWWMICVLAGIYIPVLISKFLNKSDNKVLKNLVGL